MFLASTPRTRASNVTKMSALFLKHHLSFANTASECFLDLKDVYHSFLNLFFIYFPIQMKVEGPDNTDTIRKLSSVGGHSRAERCKLQIVMSRSGFLGDDVVRDVSDVAHLEWPQQVSGSICLNSCQKVISTIYKREETAEEVWRERVIGKSLVFVGKLYGHCGSSRLGRWARSETQRSMGLCALTEEDVLLCMSTEKRTSSVLPVTRQGVPQQKA